MTSKVSICLENHNETGLYLTAAQYEKQTHKPEMSKSKRYTYIQAFMYIYIYTDTFSVKL